MKKSFYLLILFIPTLLFAQQNMSQLSIADTSRVWQGIPSLERTEKGRIFISWFSGDVEEPMPNNEVYLSISNDSKTFSAPKIIAAHKDGFRAYDPGLWIDPLGRLWYLFCRSNKETATHGIYARICDNPDADEIIWTDEFRVGYDIPYAFRLNKPTVLSTGEWLMPITYSNEEVPGWFVGKQWVVGPKVLQGVGISSDNGKTWTLHGAVDAPEWALECMITELKNGKLWMLIRTSHGKLWESFSDDKGKTWIKGRASNIPSPGTRYFIRRLASGNLLLVNHYQYDKTKFRGRSHLTAQLSLDDGKTWTEGLLLDERGKVSYPDGVEDSSGLIRIVYDRNRYKEGEILMATFTEKDVLAGKNVSNKVKLKQMINRLNK